jgi:hypothetical protein
MKAAASKLLFLGCVLESLASPAAAQTGRIALASHAGRVAGAIDNFGIVPMPADEWRADTLVYLNDSLALHSGQMRSWRYKQQQEKAVWHRRVEEEQYNVSGNPPPQVVLEELRKYYPKAVFVGFDKWGKRLKMKPSKGAQLFPKRPFQYSYWRGLAGMAALGAVGWLLGRKPGVKIG